MANLLLATLISNPAGGSLEQLHGCTLLALRLSPSYLQIKEESDEFEENILLAYGAFKWFGKLENKSVEIRKTSLISKVETE